MDLRSSKGWASSYYDRQKTLSKSVPKIISRSGDQSMPPKKKWLD